MEVREAEQPKTLIQPNTLKNQSKFMYYQTERQRAVNSEEQR